VHLFTFYRLFPFFLVQDKSYGRVGCPVATMEIKLVDWEEGGYFVSDSERGTIGLPRGEICIAGENLCAGITAPFFV
jgi:long-subunit acyl-CoA synthetase (AMP-forming)